MALFRPRKKRIVKRRSGKWAPFMFWVKRVGMVVGALVFTIWVGAWLYFSESFTKAGEWAVQQTLDITAEAGFKVEDILVEGRVHADVEVLKAVINVQKGDPLFSFNPKEAQKLVERISWVKNAHVERRLPGTIYIHLEERKPLALWQKDKKLKLIDEQGEVIVTQDLSRFEDLIIIMGEDARAQAPGLIADLAAEEILYKRVDHARLIEQRRWDLVLDKDIQVKLPESDVGLALRRLALAQEDDGLLDKDIKSIDLREPGRIVVRTKPGKVQEYKAGYRPQDSSESNI